MAHYLLSLIQPGGGDEVPPPEVLAVIMAEAQGLRDALAAQGSWVFGNGLESTSTAAVVRTGEDGTEVTAGPYWTAPEHLGGITVIDVADRDEALAWAARYAEVTTLPVEVRPFRP